MLGAWTWEAGAMVGEKRDCTLHCLGISEWGCPHIIGAERFCHQGTLPWNLTVTCHSHYSVIATWTTFEWTCLTKPLKCAPVQKEIELWQAPNDTHPSRNVSGKHFLRDFFPHS